MDMDSGEGGVFSVPSDHFWGIVALVLCPLAAWLIVCALSALARKRVAWAGTTTRRLVDMPTTAKAALITSYIGCVVHAVLVQPHWDEDRTRALLFILDAIGFAVAFGWTLLLRPYWRELTLVVAASTVGGYAYYVLNGLEEVDLVGLLTTTIELAGVLLLLVPEASYDPAGPPKRIRERWIAAVAVPLALLSVLGTNAIATATSDEAGTRSGALAQTGESDGATGMANMPGMQMGTGLPLSLATKSAAGPIVWPVSMAQMEGGMKMVTPNCTTRPTPAQQLAAVRLVNQTVKETARYKSLAAAKAAGYVPVTPTGLRVVHYINYKIYLQHKVLDPAAIPVLVYVNTNHGAVLSAAMYMAPATAVSQPGGCLTQWHIHTNLCFAHAAVVGLFNQGAGCPQGSVHQVTEPMMHVWLTPVKGGPLAPDPSTLSQMVAAYRVPAPARHNGTA